jgi:hypothetical protein
MDRVDQLHDLWASLIKLAENNVLALKGAIEALEQPCWWEQEGEAILAGERSVRPTTAEHMELEFVLAKQRAFREEGLVALRRALADAEATEQAVRTMALTCGSTVNAGTC